MKAPGLPLVGLVAVLGMGAVGLWVWKKGGLAQAGAAIGSGAVNVVGGVVSGTVGAVGGAVGLPTPAETSTDPEVARWIIDNAGQFEASKWAGAPAFIRAQFLPEGSGKPPPADSPAGRALLGDMPTQGHQGLFYDESGRLAARYPAPKTGPDSVFSGQATWGGLAGIDGGYFDWSPQPISTFGY